MPTKQQLIASSRLLIDQPTESESDFTDAQLLGFLNEGQRFLAPIIKWPRDIVEVQVEEGKPAYTLPADTILIRTAYFGNVDSTGDVAPLEILTEESLSELFPDWLDQHPDSRGTPARVIMLDRQTVLVHPTPNADAAASGKKVLLGYVYYPADLSADGDTPELPLAYHDLLPEYAQYKCYMAKLNKPDLGVAILKGLVDKAKILEPVIKKETEVVGFRWGGDEELDPDDFSSGLGLRL